MRQAIYSIRVTTSGAGLIAITGTIFAWVAAQRIDTELLTVFCRHTSASLLIQENADPDVGRDLLAYFRKIAPEDATYRHAAEGPDDMPAHIRTALTATHLAIPVERGRPVLGTWQGIYLFEHRAGSHERKVVLHLIGQ